MLSDLSSLYPFASFPLSVSLYIHIPFCERKCKYCDFFSIPEGGSYFEPVISEIEKQIESYLGGLGNPAVTSVFIGGGTPSSVPLRVLERLFRSVRRNFTDSSGEWTVEANPESLSPDFIDLCGNYGVTRLSLGVQSFRDENLRFLGRNTDAKTTRAACELAASRWKGELNLDMITCIPGQKRKDLLGDLEGGTSFSPDHFSLYCLTLEPGTVLFEELERGVFRDIPESSAEGLLRFGEEFLESRGYGHYEISNYSKPGKECRHNIGYWHLDPYIGCGPGAVSNILGDDGRALRSENTRDIGTYLQGREMQWGAETSIVEKKDLLGEFFMMGFRLTEGIEKESYRRLFGEDCSSVFRPLLDEWQDRGVLRETDSSLALTPRGRMILNALLVELFIYLDSI